MSVRASLLLCLAASCALCLPNLGSLGVTAQLLDGSVRAAIPAAMRQLRKQGLWLANATVEGVRKDAAEICFDWTYEYRSRTAVFDDKMLSTCVPR